MKLVQVLGPGCPKCEKLKKSIEEVVKQTGAAATVEKVTDMDVITGFGVMMTPAVVVDGEVKVVGRIPSADEIKKFIVG